MIRFLWLGFGLVGAIIAIFSGGIWGLAIFGGAITVVGVVLQYLDARPFDRVIAPNEFARKGASCLYQETSWRANGRVSINVFVQDGDTWTEVMADNGIGPKNRFWLAVAPNNVDSYRVVAR
jgi:hypothetical protein